MSLSDDSGPRPCAWTARSWLANKHGGHFVAVRSSSFDLPLYDQAEIDRLSARIAELHECLTKCAESAYEAGVADERERCARLCELESVTLATRDQTRGALYCAQKIRA